MKSYHTETQEDYEALMAELEKRGCKWLSGSKPTEVTGLWGRLSSETCVRVDKKVVVYARKSYYEEEYLDEPIIKYEAKADK